MNVLDWEEIEFLNSGTFEITNAGPLYAPVTAFKIFRNKDQDLILETKTCSFGKIDQIIERTYA